MVATERCGCSAGTLAHLSNRTCRKSNKPCGGCPLYRLRTSFHSKYILWGSRGIRWVIHIGDVLLLGKNGYCPGTRFFVLITEIIPDMMPSKWHKQIRRISPYSAAFTCTSKGNRVILIHSKMPFKRWWNHHQSGLWGLLGSSLRAIVRPSGKTSHPQGYHIPCGSES